jgi:sec-independent protein translocase protein TatC
LFQLPLIMLFINRVTPQRPRKLMSYQRWVILGSFILAAILTPTPDPLNQTLMATPMIALYQVGVLAVWLQNRRHVKVSRPAEVAPVRAEATPVAADDPIARPKPQPRYSQPRYFDIIPQRRGH